MDKRSFISYIENNYGIIADCPWVKSPDAMVFRHKDSRKWFALVLTIPKNKLGLSGDDNLDIANVKCDPILIGSLIAEKGIFPAYHMNKQNWITLALDNTVDTQKIKMLIDLSFNLTSRKGTSRNA